MSIESFAFLKLVRNLVGSFAKDKSSNVATRYGLIAAGLAVAIIAVILALGTQQPTPTFQPISHTLGSVHPDNGPNDEVTGDTGMPNPWRHLELRHSRGREEDIREKNWSRRLHRKAWHYYHDATDERVRKSSRQIQSA